MGNHARGTGPDPVFLNSTLKLVKTPHSISPQDMTLVTIVVQNCKITICIACPNPERF